MGLHNKENRYFHVTPIHNLDSILKNGLIPSIGEHSSNCKEKFPAIWLFPDFHEMENALENWLGDIFNDYEEEMGKAISLAILQIDVPKDFPVECSFDSNGNRLFEAHSKVNIPSKFITAVYDESYKKISARRVHDVEEAR